MGLGASKPASKSRNSNGTYVIKASRTSCTYNSTKGAWVCNSVRLNRNNNNVNTTDTTDTNTTASSKKTKKTTRRAKKTKKKTPKS
jgi:hypothetical protein